MVKYVKENRKTKHDGRLSKECRGTGMHQIITFLSSLNTTEWERRTKLCEFTPTLSWVQMFSDISLTGFFLMTLKSHEQKAFMASIA